MVDPMQMLMMMVDSMSLQVPLKPTGRIMVQGKTLLPYLCYHRLEVLPHPGAVAAHSSLHFPKMQITGSYYSFFVWQK
jgi:hypothetical protein